MKLGAPVPSQIRAFLISRSSMRAPLSCARPFTASLDPASTPLPPPSMASPGGRVKAYRRRARTAVANAVRSARRCSTRSFADLEVHAAVAVDDDIPEIPAIRPIVAASSTDSHPCWASRASVRSSWTHVSMKTSF